MSENPPLPHEPWPPKAYKNDEFLQSREARKIRVMCEMTEPEVRFAKHNIKDTIVFFGSARSVPTTIATERLKAIEEELGDKDDLAPEEETALRKARAVLKMGPYYDAAAQLAEAMTKWSRSLDESTRRFIVCTGGGPGMMEAANAGAHRAGGPNIGLGISLPFEQGLNEHITHDLQFEFHYFFIRKYWLAYWAKALVVFPGGFGTMDELFELLTLVQTRKVTRETPIILYGAEFWNSVINFDAFVEWGVISARDLSLFKICDSVEDARDYLVEELSRLYLTTPRADD